MTPRTQYYDPFVESRALTAVPEPELTPKSEPIAEVSPIRGFPVAVEGTYVLLDDVVRVLREFAQSLSDPDDGALIHEVATWLGGGSEPVSEPVQAQSVQPGPPHGAEDDDVTPDVDRVEIFPTEAAEGGSRKWHARSIDTAGNVMKVTGGSFDKSWVEKNAQDRWPGITIHEVQSEDELSMDKERGKRGFNRRLWAAACE